MRLNIVKLPQGARFICLYENKKALCSYIRPLKDQQIAQ